MTSRTRIQHLLAEIENEFNRAASLHGPMTSPHEGIGVIREEYLELEREVFKKVPRKI